MNIQQDYNGINARAIPVTIPILEQAQGILTAVEGTTDTRALKDAMSALNDLLTLQKAQVQKAHKAVNSAKEAEDDERLTYKMIENMLKKATMARQELRDDKYSNGL